MAALSDYLENKLLNHIFRNTDFDKPAKIAIALTSGVVLDSNTGSDLPELPYYADGVIETGYTRIDMGETNTEGDTNWSEVGADTLSPYQIYSTQVDHSGYFYPLYLSEADPAVTYTVFKFDHFGDVEFFAPPQYSSGVEIASNSYIMYEGNGFIKNLEQIIFPTANTEWGWVSGIAILDSADVSAGNLLMHAPLGNPRYVYKGDTIRFDPNSLEISLN